MITRTRYRQNYKYCYLNPTGSNYGFPSNFTSVRGYYDKGIYKEVHKSGNGPNRPILDMNHIDRFIDHRLSATEKSQLTRKGHRVYWSKPCEHYTSLHSLHDGYAKGLLVRGPTTYGPRNEITFWGLPYQSGEYFGFNISKMRAAGLTMLNHNTDFPPLSSFTSAFQRMTKDANLLNLHDQNLFTTIGELKDFKKTVQTVTKHVFRDKRYIADKYLGVSFGIIPFYSDMKNYVENYNNFAPNLKKWNDLGKKGKILNKHATIIKKRPTTETAVITSGILRFPDGKSPYHYRFDYVNTFEYKATASVYFRARPLSSSDEPLLLASINGLSKPFTAAWNLIPFSFLVDWFVNVGDQIEAFEHHRPVVKFDILDGCGSFMQTQKITCKTTLVDLTTGNEYHLGTTEKNYRYYKRLSFKDTAIDTIVNGPGINSPLVFTPELSGTQWSLAAALAVTNFPRKK